MFTHAITRLPGNNFSDGVTTAGLGKPSFELMKAQHTAYISALRALGIQVEVLPALLGFPDAYFVEDPAIVFPELAVITRPGAASRAGEESYLEPVLSRYRKLARISPPATLEGGDVLVVGKQVWVGLSERTNAAGATQLTQILSPLDYRVTPVPLAGGLHLKSGVNTLGGRYLLMTQDFTARPEFAGYTHIIVPMDESYAANTLFGNGSLLTPKGFSQTNQMLQPLGLPIIELDVSEVQKMDGGLTCMSLRF